MTTLHRHLAPGDALARRYRSDVNRFAAARDDSRAALDALARLVGEDDDVYLLQARPVVVPEGLRATMTRDCVQMTAARLAVGIEGHDEHPIVELGDADAGDMLALATLTRPGPFMRHTHHMGRFVGVRIHGRLAAMAGERFRFSGYTEVSGVCTHPDFRGRGLAARLSRHVASRILARGEMPFLQSWSSHAQAIRLYERLGFRVRREIHVAVLARAD